MTEFAMETLGLASVLTFKCAQSKLHIVTLSIVVQAEH